LQCAIVAHIINSRPGLARLNWMAENEKISDDSGFNRWIFIAVRVRDKAA
jgi:hypothetical protein